MSTYDTSPLSGQTTNDSATSKPTAATNGQNHLKQKRARSQLSCTPCRQGKLKCNRQHACDQCIKRNREPACVFLPPPVKHKPAQNVKGRIRQLESLVVDLMNQKRDAQDAPSDKSQPVDKNGIGAPFSQPTPPSDNDISPQFGEQGPPRSSSQGDVDAATTPFGQMKISKDEISYVGESHWGAILNSISDLKRDLEEEEEDEEKDTDASGSPESAINSWGSSPTRGVQPHSTTGLGFMLGEATTATRDQLINSVPEKKIADRLLSLWFNSPDPFKPVIHAPTFQDEYRRFWRSPRESSTMWLGLFYAILSLATSFGLRDIDPNSPQAQAILADVNKYHSLAASAAVSADFTKPKQYTLECLILYAAGLRSNNAFVNVWLMIGLIMRLALRMGYHRDPSHYPAISVFHGEMRRRVWAAIGMIDVLISFQLGLPSMFKTIQSDTSMPRNLLDRDFGPSSTVLPPSRGIEELTPSSYTRAKLRLVRVFANAAELSHATVAPSQDETMRLDAELEGAKAAIPPLLQMPDISELVTDSAEQLMCRFNLDLLYLKTKIVLHRRYMLTPLSQLTTSEQQRGIGTSRQNCIECALRVLQHHHEIYAASQTGGQLETVKFYMGSISTHDFLLAAMILCLELNEQILQKEFLVTRNGIACPKRRAMMEALEKSQQIWSDTSRRKNFKMQFIAKDQIPKGEHMYDETEKASRAMAVMIERVKKHLAKVTPEPSGAAASPVAGLDVDIGEVYPNSDSKSDNTQSKLYSGAFSNHQWSDWNGVPESLDADSILYASEGPTSGFSNTIDSSMGQYTASQSQRNDVPPYQDFDQQLDFTMIGDMLDVPNNLDWEMWDNQIIKGPQTSYADWPNISFESMDNFSGNQDFKMRSGNAAVGGTGPIAAEHAAVPGGMDPVNGRTETGFNPYMMNDVDFDIGQLDYGGNEWMMQAKVGGFGRL